MRRKTGYTLIELLIALTVFAILAMLTSSAMYYAFSTRARVAAQADRLVTLQLALTLIARDTEQAVNRPIRGNDMHAFPAFVGQPAYIEFTRDGLANPNSMEKRSTLQRVALLCRDHQLVRKTWESLDPLDRNQSEEKILLTDLKECQFRYLNQTLQVLSEWHNAGSGQNQESEPLPKAMQLTLTLNDWDKLNWLSIFPKALYDKTT